jgi:dihydropteroate synthase
LVIPLRIVPPLPAQLSADPDAAVLAVVRDDLATLGLASSAVGLGIERREGEAWLRVSRAQLGTLRDELGRRGSPLALWLSRYLQPVPAWQLRTRALSLGETHIMGILNLTSDSFSGDGLGTDIARALAHADRQRGEGACIIDVGAESARADRPVLEEGLEAELMGNAIRALVGEGHSVSADTYKPSVAQAALDSGAECVNDISGLTLGPRAAEAAQQAGAGYVLNYSFSVPKKRPHLPPRYADVVGETNDWFADRLTQLETMGVARESIAIDPGIAFGKSHDEDLQVLRRLGEFAVHGQPVLIAHSRKNFLGSVSETPPAERDLQTHVVSALAWAAGARIFRVHDVAGTRKALGVAQAIAGGSAGDYAPDAESWPWRAGAAAVHMTAGAPDKAAPGGQRW